MGVFTSETLSRCRQSSQPRSSAVRFAPNAARQLWPHSAHTVAGRQGFMVLLRGPLADISQKCRFLCRTASLIARERSDAPEFVLLQKKAVSVQIDPTRDVLECELLPIRVLPLF